MFLSNDCNCSYILNKPITDVPSFIKNPNFTIAPRKKVGVHSGSFLIASYYDSIRVMSTFSFPEMTDNRIIEVFYTSILRDGQTYITFIDAMNRLCKYLNDICQNFNDNDYILFNLLSFDKKNSNDEQIINLTKHFIHKHSVIVVEMQSNSSYCSSSSSEMIGKFVIDKSLNILDSRLSKGFLACGYDQDGILLFNSLGKGYGQNGFIKMNWNVFKSNLIRVAAISNLYY